MAAINTKKCDVSSAGSKSNNAYTHNNKSQNVSCISASSATMQLGGVTQPSDHININILNENKSYYTIDEFNNLKTSLDELLIFSMNINSLRKYSLEFTNFINCLDSKPDIIILTEIRHNIDDIANSMLQDYLHVVTYPIDNKCGGIITLYRNNLKVTQLCPNLMFQGIENILLEIKLVNKSLYVCGLYKHPYVKPKCVQKHIENILNLIPKKSNLIIAGDFNIDLQKKNSILDTRNFMDKMLSKNLYQVINAPTRITDHSSTLIDHIYIRTNNRLNIRRGIMLQSISDHLCTFISLTKQEKNHANIPQKTRILNDVNIELFKNKLSDIHNAVTNNLTCSTNYIWNLFTNNIKSMYEECFPLKTLSKNQLKNKAWFTAGLKKSAKTKEKLYKNWLANKTEPKALKYKNYKNAYNKALRLAKQNYYRKLFSTDTDNKKMWTEVKTIISKRKDNGYLDSLRIGDRIATNPETISNEMNTFFSTIGEKMGNNFTHNNQSNPYNYMPQRSNSSILLRKTTESEIKKIIHQLPNKTSSGDDLISQKLLKAIVHEISPILRVLINKSIEEKTYPECLKLTKIIPIHKSGAKDECTNYRPISLLSSFDKIFEKIIQNDLVSFVEQENILYVKQFGFRKYHSTIDALISAHDFVIDNLRAKKKILGIFIDLKKAFDSIDLNILVNKLHYYGITGPFNDLLKSYVTGRHIYTYINSTKSQPMPINFGVPQGSVLGPLLFSLYINDIKNMATNNEINLFADDTCIFCTADNNNELQENANETLANCHQWLVNNRLTLNTEKTHYLNFSKDRSSTNISLHLENTQISQQRETKYLGIILQDDLKWEKHIQATIQKLNKQIPLYLAIRDILPIKKNSIIFNAISFSKINYGIELYGRKNTKWLCQLQKTQNRLLKTLSSKPKLFSTNSIHKSLDILKIHDQAKVRLMLTAHNYIHKKDKLNYAYRNVKLNSDVHNRMTRNNNNIHIGHQAFNTNNLVMEQSAIWWNDLNASQKNIKNRETFKEKTKKNIIDLYN